MDDVSELFAIAIVWHDCSLCEEVDSPFYIERHRIKRCSVESECYQEIEKPGSLVRIRAPKKMGKTSLIKRIQAKASENNYISEYLKFDILIEPQNIRSVNNFIKVFNTNINCRFPDVSERPDWDDNNAIISCTRDLKALLLNLQKNMVLILDEMDKIYKYEEITEGFCAMLRHWYEESSNVKIWKNLRSVSLAIAGLVSVGVIGIRALGLLQPLELNEFDRLMRWRPAEKPDPNILIVEATKQDIRQFGVGYTLEDGRLAEVIAKIDALQPAIIGLDLWREKYLKSEANYRKLLTLLANNQKIIAVCSTSEYRPHKPGSIPPEGVPKERLGFTDLVVDNGQVDIVRRYLMFMGEEETDLCKTGYSLSARVALDFLAIQGIKPENTPQGNIKIGDVTLKRLTKGILKLCRIEECHYQNVDDAENAPQINIKFGDITLKLLVRIGQGIYQNFNHSGFQLLLNYRNAVDNKVAKIISISDILNGEINDSLVKDKIVLIGITDSSAGDKFYTPYSSIQRPNQKQMPGVILHAHQVSQIISAVLYGRPLITFWNWWIEWLWILAWSVFGCVVNRHFLRGFSLFLFVGGNIIVLYSVSLFILTQGFVVPLVPSILVLIVNSVIILIDDSHFFRWDKIPIIGVD